MTLNKILAITNASSVKHTETVQTLWRGYGAIMRYVLAGGKHPSVIVKHIQLPNNGQHTVSHQRKLTSYKVERTWYHQYQTDAYCRVPHCYHTVELDNELLLVMEDLDAIGYPVRLTPDTVTIADAKTCLTWLAHFHARFMGVAPEGLWPVGTYWHLDTRPEEWDRMKNFPLKNVASAIDKMLNNATYQTLVHGDAKLANFCFSNTAAVAAVDFQYVGKGCGIKDVAYFISSCFDQTACEKHEGELMAHYFCQLEKALDKSHDYQQIKAEWSKLYRYAWADFYRFLDGWCSGHWKMHDYSKRLTQQVIEELTIS